MKDLALTGLDGQNPLAFFAALGLLRVLDERLDEKAERPRLWFVDDGRQTAYLRSPLDLDEICEVIRCDARGDLGRAALSLSYYKDGGLARRDDKSAVAELKPTEDDAREFLSGLLIEDRRSLDLGSAFFSEYGYAQKGDAKPTAFHFTAGNQQFLKMANVLASSIDIIHLREAILGPWKNEDQLPSFRWNSSGNRTHALQAVKPADDSGSVAGANWLAVIGLSYFPVNVRRGQLETTGVTGGWKNGVFHWPVWSAPSTRLEVASLLRGDVTRLRRQEREALGVTQVFSSAITRSDQGGYGSFSPADVALPPRP